jgi:surface antigen
MMTLDEGTLIAYVDGELDPQTAREVESGLAKDDRARKDVEHLRALAALTRVAFNDTLHEAVPQHLKDAALGRTVKGVTISQEQPHSGNVITFTSKGGLGSMHRALPLGLAAAAAFAGLVLGLGGGSVYTEASANKALQLAALSMQQDQNAMNQALNQALEVNVSGNALTWVNPDTGRSAAFTPVRTYQDKSGQFCREYRKDVKSTDRTDTTFGLACRDESGMWKTRYLILENGPEQAL